MVNYQNGKIYKITSKETNKIYIGSTCKKTLQKRLNFHKSQYRNWIIDNKYTYVSSYDILKYDEAIIELLEKYPCENKKQLTERERYYVEQNKEIVVNKYIPSRTKKEYGQLYQKTEKYKEMLWNYYRRPEYKEKSKIRAKTDQYKANQKKYKMSEDAKLKRNVHLKMKRFTVKMDNIMEKITYFDPIKIIHISPNIDGPIISPYVF